MKIKNWFWDPVTLTLTQSFTWDSGKKGVNWESEDRMLIIINGVWHIKYGFEWDGTTGVSDGPYLKEPHHAPILSSKHDIPITWMASLIHDLGYVYMDEKDFPYSRKEIDIYFHQLLVKCGFKYHKLYLWGVRKLGAIYHWVRAIFVH